jgi:hypothetical protein
MPSLDDIKELRKHSLFSITSPNQAKRYVAALNYLRWLYRDYNGDVYRVAQEISGQSKLWDSTGVAIGLYQWLNAPLATDPKTKKPTRLLYEDLVACREFLDQLANSPEQRQKSLKNTIVQVGGVPYSGMRVAQYMAAIARAIDYYLTMTDDPSLKELKQKWNAYLSSNKYGKQILTPGLWEDKKIGDLLVTANTLFSYFAPIVNHSISVTKRIAPILERSHQGVSKDNKNALTGLVTIGIVSALGGLHGSMFSSVPLNVQTWETFKKEAQQTHKAIVSQLKTPQEVIKSFWSNVFKQVSHRDYTVIGGLKELGQEVYRYNYQEMFEPNEKILPPELKHRVSDTEKELFGFTRSFTASFAGWAARGFRYARGLIKIGPETYAWIDIPISEVPFVENRKKRTWERVGEWSGATTAILRDIAITWGASALARGAVAGVGMLSKLVRASGIAGKMFTESEKIAKFGEAASKALTALRSTKIGEHLIHLAPFSSVVGAEHAIEVFKDEGNARKAVLEGIKSAGLTEMQVLLMQAAGAPAARFVARHLERIPKLAPREVMVGLGTAAATRLKIQNPFVTMLRTGIEFGVGAPAVGIAFDTYRTIREGEYKQLPSVIWEHVKEAPSEFLRGLTVHFPHFFGEAEAYREAGRPPTLPTTPPTPPAPPAPQPPTPQPPAPQPQAQQPPTAPPGAPQPQTLRERMEAIRQRAQELRQADDMMRQAEELLRQGKAVEAEQLRKQAEQIRAKYPPSPVEEPRVRKVEITFGEWRTAPRGPASKMLSEELAKEPDPLSIAARARVRMSKFVDATVNVDVTPLEVAQKDRSFEKERGVLRKQREQAISLLSTFYRRLGMSEDMARLLAQEVVDINIANSLAESGLDLKKGLDVPDYLQQEAKGLAGGDAEAQKQFISKLREGFSKASQRLDTVTGLLTPMMTGVADKDIALHFSHPELLRFSMQHPLWQAAGDIVTASRPAIEDLTVTLNEPGTWNKRPRVEISANISARNRTAVDEAINEVVRKYRMQPEQANALRVMAHALYEASPFGDIDVLRRAGLYAADEAWSILGTVNNDAELRSVAFSHPDLVVPLLMRDEAQLTATIKARVVRYLESLKPHEDFKVPEEDINALAASVAKALLNPPVPYLRMRPQDARSKIEKWISEELIPEQLAIDVIKVMGKVTPEEVKKGLADKAIISLLDTFDMAAGLEKPEYALAAGYYRALLSSRLMSKERARQHMLNLLRGGVEKALTKFAQEPPSELSEFFGTLTKLDDALVKLVTEKSLDANDTVVEALEALQKNIGDADAWGVIVGDELASLIAKHKSSPVLRYRAERVVNAARSVVGRKLVENIFGFIEAPFEEYKGAAQKLTEELATGEVSDETRSSYDQAVSKLNELTTTLVTLIKGEKIHGDLARLLNMYNRVAGKVTYNEAMLYLSRHLENLQLLGAMEQQLAKETLSHFANVAVDEALSSLKVEETAKKEKKAKEKKIPSILQLEQILPQQLYRVLPSLEERLYLVHEEIKRRLLEDENLSRLTLKGMSPDTIDDYLMGRLLYTLGIQPNERTLGNYWRSLPESARGAMLDGYIDAQTGRAREFMRIVRELAVIPERAIMPAVIVTPPPTPAAGAFLPPEQPIRALPLPGQPRGVTFVPTAPATTPPYGIRELPPVSEVEGKPTEMPSIKEPSPEERIEVSRLEPITEPPKRERGEIEVEDFVISVKGTPKKVYVSIEPWGLLRPRFDVWGLRKERDQAVGEKDVVPVVAFPSSEVVLNSVFATAYSDEKWSDLDRARRQETKTVLLETYKKWSEVTSGEISDMMEFWYQVFKATNINLAEEGRYVPLGDQASQLVRQWIEEAEAGKNTKGAKIVNQFGLERVKRWVEYETRAFIFPPVLRAEITEKEGFAFTYDLPESLGYFPIIRRPSEEAERSAETAPGMQVAQTVKGSEPVPPKAEPPTSKEEEREQRRRRIAESLLSALEEESQPGGWLGGRERLRLSREIKVLEERLSKARSILNRLRVKGEDWKIPILEKIEQRLQEKIERRKARLARAEELREARKELYEAFSRLVKTVGKEKVASDADAVLRNPYYSMPFALAHEFIKSTGLPLTRDAEQLATAINEAKISGAMTHTVDACISALFRMRTSHRVFVLLSLVDPEEFERVASTKHVSSLPKALTAEREVPSEPTSIAELILSGPFNIETATPSEIAERLALELYHIALETTQSYSHLLTSSARKALTKIIYKVLLYSARYPRVTEQNTKEALKLWRTLMYGTEELPLEEKGLKDLEYKAFMGINTINSYLNNAIVITLPTILRTRPRPRAERATKEPREEEVKVDLSKYRFVAPEGAIVEEEAPVEEGKVVEEIAAALREPLPEEVEEGEVVGEGREIEEEIEEEVEKEGEAKAPPKTAAALLTYDKVVERARRRIVSEKFEKQLIKLYKMRKLGKLVSIFTIREGTPVPVKERVRPMSFGEALEAFDETMATVVARHLVGKASPSSNVYRWATTRYEGALKVIPFVGAEHPEEFKNLGFVVSGLAAFREAVEHPMVLSEKKRWASTTTSLEELREKAEEAMEEGEEVEELPIRDLITMIYMPDVEGMAADIIPRSMITAIDKRTERVIETTDKLLTAPFSDIAKAALIFGLHEPYEVKIEEVGETAKLPSLIGAIWRGRNMSEAYALSAIEVMEEYAGKPIGNAFAKVSEILQSWNAIMQAGGEQAHFWGKIALIRRDISSLEDVLTELRKAAEKAPHELPEGVTFEEFASVVDQALRHLHNQRMAIEASLSSFPIVNKVAMTFSELSRKLREDEKLKEMANTCREVADLEDEKAILEKEKEITEFALTIIGAFKDSLRFFDKGKEFAIQYLSYIAYQNLPHLSLGEVYTPLHNAWVYKTVVREGELTDVEEEAKRRAIKAAKIKLGAEVFAAIADHLQKHTASYEAILRMCVGAVSRRAEEYTAPLSVTEVEVDYGKGRLSVLGIDVSNSLIALRQSLERYFRDTGKAPTEATYQYLGKVIENMLHTTVVQLTAQTATEITKEGANPRNIIIRYLDELKERVKDFSYESYRKNRPLYFYLQTLDGILDIIKEHVKEGKVSDDVLKALFGVYNLHVQLKSLPIPREEKERILGELATRVEELSSLAVRDEALQALMTDFNNLLAIQETLSVMGRRIGEALQKGEVVNLLKSLEEKKAEVKEAEAKEAEAKKAAEEVEEAAKPKKKYTYAATLTFNLRGLPEVRVDLSRLYDVSGHEPIRALSGEVFRAIGENKALYVSRDALTDYAKTLKTVADFAFKSAQVEGDEEAIDKARYFGEYVDALVRTLEKLPMDNIILRVERPGEITERVEKAREYMETAERVGAKTEAREIYEQLSRRIYIPTELYEVAQEAVRKVIGKEEFEKEIQEKEKALQRKKEELEEILEDLESRAKRSKSKELMERLEQARAEYERVNAALERIPKLREVLTELASKELPELSQLPLLLRHLHERPPEPMPEEEPTTGVVNLGVLPFLPITTDALQSMINHTALAQWHDLLTSGVQGIITGVIATYYAPRALHEFLKLFPSYNNYVRNIHNLIERPPAPRSKIEEVMARLMHGERIDESELRFTLDYLLKDIEEGKIKFEIPTGLYKMSNPLTRTQLVFQEIGKQIAQNIGADPEVVTTFLYQALIGNGIAARRKARTDLAPRLFGYFAAAEHALMGGKNPEALRGIERVKNIVERWWTRATNPVLKIKWQLWHENLRNVFDAIHQEIVGTKLSDELLADYNEKLTRAIVEEFDRLDASGSKNPAEDVLNLDIVDVLAKIHNVSRRSVEDALMRLGYYQGVIRLREIMNVLSFDYNAKRLNGQTEKVTVNITPDELQRFKTASVYYLVGSYKIFDLYNDAVTRFSSYEDIRPKITHLSFWAPHFWDTSFSGLIKLWSLERLASITRSPDAKILRYAIEGRRAVARQIKQIESEPTTVEAALRLLATRHAPYFEVERRVLEGYLGWEDPFTSALRAAHAAAYFSAELPAVAVQDMFIKKLLKGASNIRDEGLKRQYLELADEIKNVAFQQAGYRPFYEVGPMWSRWVTRVTDFLHSLAGKIIVPLRPLILLKNLVFSWSPYFLINPSEPTWKKIKYLLHGAWFTIADPEFRKFVISNPAISEISLDVLYGLYAGFLKAAPQGLSENERARWALGKLEEIARNPSAALETLFKVIPTAGEYLFKIADAVPRIVIFAAEYMKGLNEGLPHEVALSRANTTSLMAQAPLVSGGIPYALSQYPPGIRELLRAITFFQSYGLNKAFLTLNTFKAISKAPPREKLWMTLNLGLAYTIDFLVAFGIATLLSRNSEDVKKLLVRSLLLDVIPPVIGDALYRVYRVGERWEPTKTLRVVTRDLETGAVKKKWDEIVAEYLQTGMEALQAFAGWFPRSTEWGRGTIGAPLSMPALDILGDLITNVHDAIGFMAHTSQTWEQLKKRYPDVGDLVTAMKLVYQDPLATAIGGDRVVQDWHALSILLHILSRAAGTVAPVPEFPVVPETVANALRGYLDMRVVNELTPRYNKEFLDDISKFSKAYLGIKELFHVFRGSPMFGKQLVYSHIIHQKGFQDDVKHLTLLKLIPDPDQKEVSPQFALSTIYELFDLALTQPEVRRFIIKYKNSVLGERLRKYARLAEQIRSKHGKPIYTEQMFDEAMRAIEILASEDEKKRKEAQLKEQAQGIFPLPATLKGTGGEKQ